MDKESLALLQQAVADGITSRIWIVLVLSLIAGGVGAFLGAYLRKKGFDKAVDENFDDMLLQLKQQTKTVEDIKHDFESRQAHDTFLRELYVADLKAYCSEQAYGLRQAYLHIFERESSSIGSSEEDGDTRMETAVRAVMDPLRKYTAVVDEATLQRIYGVQHALLQLKGVTARDLIVKRNEYFNLVDSARQFVVLDRLAYRLGLIERVLERRTGP